MDNTSQRLIRDVGRENTMIRTSNPMINLMLRVITYLAGGALALLSLFSGVWSILCFIGGPDGHTGSKESIIAGCISLGCLAMFGAASIGFFIAAARARDESRPRFYTWMLMAAPVVLLVAIILLCLL